MTQSTDYLPLQLGAYSLVLVYSNVQHALTGGEYNARRHQCFEGLQVLRHVLGTKTFRDADAGDILSIRDYIDEAVWMRCTYVVEEIQRTKEAAMRLQEGDMEGLGALMYATHKGLSALYNVSLPELDYLVAYAKQYEGVAGARLMGGGFGGCTLNLVRKEVAAAFATDIQQAYRQKFGIEANVYPVQAVDGAHILA
jgi:galactokinase